jgi:hypothetical protein
LALQRVNNIERSYSLSLGMFCVGDGITDDTFQESLQNTTSLFIYHRGDTFDTTTAGQTTDGRLSDTLNVVAQNLAVTLCTTLSKAFATLAT